MLNIIHYLFIGTMFTMVVDIATWYAKKQGVEAPSTSEWNWSTRFMAILIWPLGVLYFVIGFITEVTKKNKKR